MIYIVIPVVLLSFFSIIVIIGKDLNKKLTEDINRKKEIKTNIVKTSEFITVGEFREMKNEFSNLIKELETNNKISTLQSKYVEQLKSKVENLEKQVLYEQEVLAKVRRTSHTALQRSRIAFAFATVHSKRNIHHHGNAYSETQRLDEHEYTNDVFGKSNELVSGSYKLVTQRNPVLGKIRN